MTWQNFHDHDVLWVLPKTIKHRCRCVIMDAYGCNGGMFTGGSKNKTKKRSNGRAGHVFEVWKRSKNTSYWQRWWWCAGRIKGRNEEGSKGVIDVMNVFKQRKNKKGSREAKRNSKTSAHKYVNQSPHIVKKKNDVTKLGKKKHKKITNKRKMRSER